MPVVVPTTCWNYLKTSGEEEDILKFCNEVMSYCDEPVEDLKFDDCDYTIDDKNDDYQYEIQRILYEQNYLQTQFESNWRPPDDFIKRIMTEYSTLTFEFRYCDGCNFSGVVESYFGEIITNEEGRNGEYYGENDCDFCDSCNDYGEYFCHKFNCCRDCEEEINDSISIIDRFVYSKKIKLLNKSLALKRMGRNQIMDNYIMRKVYMPRLF